MWANNWTAAKLVRLMRRLGLLPANCSYGFGAACSIAGGNAGWRGMRATDKATKAFWYRVEALMNRSGTDRRFLSAGDVYA